MKKTFKKNLLQFIMLIFFSPIIFNSCQNDESISLKENNTKQVDFEIIKSLGLDTDSILDLGEYYLVEEHFLFEKKTLSNYLQPTGTKQATTGSLINISNQRNITVAVASSIPTSGKNNWRNEVIEAINEWNNTGSNISLTYTTLSNPDLLIIADGGTLPSNVIASATFPASGKIGNIIRVNLDFYGDMTVSSSQKKYNMVHEIGHCLGFRHTNWSGMGESSAQTVQGTPNSGSNPDPSSVMNGGTALNSWNGFSSYDRIAIQNLYPLQNIIASMETSYSSVNFYVKCKNNITVDWGDGSKSVINPSSVNRVLVSHTFSNSAKRTIKLLGLTTTLTYISTDNNGLTAFDASNSTELDYVSVSYNNLISFEPSKYPKVSNMGCAYNKITSIDISKNPLLVSFSCEMNQLTSLNISLNPKLEYLAFAHNSISSIDVTKHPLLRTIIAHATKISDLNIAKNPNLAKITCHATPLASNSSQVLKLAQSLPSRLNLTQGSLTVSVSNAQAKSICQTKNWAYQ